MKTSTKREFVTYWNRTVVTVEEGIDLKNDASFQHENHGVYAIIHPEILFGELTPFENKKTRVIIEVIE